MATALLQSIDDKIASLIQGIRANPYNYQWGTSNQRDMAKASFPSANIYLESETNVDENNGTWAQSYMNELTYRIEVKAQLSGEFTNPIQEIHKNLFKCLDDLKRLFGNKWNMESTCDTIMYKSMEIIEERSGDIFIPSKMITRWLVRYEQDRLDPTVTVQ
jgi:hypothetical protein